MEDMRCGNFQNFKPWALQANWNDTGLRVACGSLCSRKTQSDPTCQKTGGSVWNVVLATDGKDQLDEVCCHGCTWKKAYPLDQNKTTKLDRTCPATPVFAVRNNWREGTREMRTRTTTLYVYSPTPEWWGSWWVRRTEVSSRRPPVIDSNHQEFPEWITRIELTLTFEKDDFVLLYIQFNISHR